MTKKDVIKKETEVVGKYGVRDSEGNIIVPIEYDFVTKVNDNLFVAKKGKVNGLRYQNNIEAREEEAGYLYGEYYEYLLEHKALDTEVDFYTKKGKLYIGNKYRVAVVCKNDDMLLLLGEDYKWSMGLIDYQNQIIIGGAYVDVDSIKMDYYNNRFIITLNDKYVIVSFKDDNRVKQTTPLLPCKPVKLTENGAIFEHKNKYGFFNYSGEILLCAMYDRIIPEKKHVQAIGNRGIDLYTYSGHHIVGSENYEKVETVNFDDVELMILQHKDGTYGLYSINDQLLPCKYSSIEMCEEFAIVSQNAEYALLRYDKEADKMVAVFPEDYPKKSFSNMRFLYTKAATYVVANSSFMPEKNNFRYNLDYFKK